MCFFCFPVGCFSSVCIVLLSIYFPIILDGLLFSDGREKERVYVDLGGGESEEDLGGFGFGGMENHNQHILNEKLFLGKN